MMYRVVCFLVFVALRGVIAQSDCVPEPVEDLTLSLNYTLSWTASANCNVTHYIIYIHSDDGLEYIYQTDGVALDVAFLPACERYRFTIMAYDSHMSASTTMITWIPAPPGANLTMSNFVVAQRDNGVYLSWQVEYQYAHCAQYFRVIVWDYEHTPIDIYTSYTDLVVSDIVPCANYELGVMAIYNLQTEGPPALRTYTAPAAKTPLPILQQVLPGSTNVYLTWGLPNYTINRCTITGINVDASPNFNTTFPVVDSAARPPVIVNVSPLRTDTMYLMRVSILNSGGASNTLPIAVQTLPALAEVVNMNNETMTVSSSHMEEEKYVPRIKLEPCDEGSTQYSKIYDELCFIKKEDISIKLDTRLDIKQEADAESLLSEEPAITHAQREPLSNPYKFRCELCPYISHRKGHLLRHIQRHKKPPKVYSCERCHYIAKRKDTLNNHMIRHKDSSQAVTFKCEFCSFTSPHKYSLQRHVLTHKVNQS